MPIRNINTTGGNGMTDFVLSILIVIAIAIGIVIGIRIGKEESK